MEGIFENETISLTEAPEKLKETVMRYLDRYPDAKLLEVNHTKKTPYIDKTILDNTYTTYLMRGNLFMVMKISLCSKPEWSDRDVRESSMIAGDIAKIVKLGGAWFSEYNGWESE